MGLFPKCVSVCEAPNSLKLMPLRSLGSSCFTKVDDDPTTIKIKNNTDVTGWRPESASISRICSKSGSQE